MCNLYYCHILMRVFKILTLFMLITGLASCNTEQKKLQKIIEVTEASVDKENIESASALAKLYEEFATKFKQDEKAPIYLIKAAELYQTTGNYHKSIELFDYVTERYPDNEKAADALFYKGFVYENQLNDIKRAKATYDEFLKLYPNHDMAESVRQNLPTIGKDSMPDWVYELDKKDGEAN